MLGMLIAFLIFSCDQKSVDPPTNPPEDFPTYEKSTQADRMAFRDSKSLDANGQFDKSAINKGYEQFINMLTKQPDGVTAGLPTNQFPGSTLPPYSSIKTPDFPGWKRLGPGNIGGMISAIAVDQSDDTGNTVLAASWTGGVWKTTDGGSTWSAISDTFGIQNIGSLMFSPSNPDTLYAGTGDLAYYQGDGPTEVGVGIFVSGDGGSTWTRMDGTSDFGQVSYISLTKDGNQMLAATGDGIQLWSRSDNSWTKSTGVSGKVNTVAFHPTDNSIAVAGHQTNGTAYYSTDGGKSWNVAKADNTMQSIYVTWSLGTNKYVYASAAPTQWNTNTRLWRSDNNGQTYSVQPGTGPQGYGSWTNVCWAGDPTDEDLVVVGGIYLFRSTDGGASNFTQITNGSTVHVDNHALVTGYGYNGSSTNRPVYLGCDGGIYKTGDIKLASSSDNSTWERFFSEGFDLTMFYGGSGNFSSGHVVGGAQDNSSMGYSPDSGYNAWVPIAGGDGGPTAADQNDPNTFYLSAQNLWLIRNSNGATSNTYDYIANNISDNSVFEAPILLDPNNSNMLYAGGSKLWRTNNPKANPASDVSWTDLTITGSSGHISSIDVAPGNSDLIVLGFDNGGIFMTTDGTQSQPSWTNIGSSINANRYCNRVAIDPNVHNTMYAVFGGYQSGNIWKTLDGGSNWTDISGNLPEVPFHWVTVHPYNSNFVYVGTEIGIFVSNDGGTTWAANSEGPVGIQVYQIFWMGTTMVAVTFGRSMYHISVPNNMQSMAVVGDNVYRINYTDNSVEVHNSGGGWTTIGSNAKLLEAYDNNLIMIDRNDGSIKSYDSGTNWTTIGYNASMLASGEGNLYCINNENGSIYQYSGSGTNWSSIGDRASMITAGDAGVFIYSQDNNIYRYNGSGTDWTAVGTGASIMTSGTNAYVQDVDYDDLYIYKGSPNNWTQIGSWVASIAPGASNICYVVSTQNPGTVWEVNTNNTPAASTKIYTDSNVIQVIYSNNTLYRQDYDFSIWQYNGTPDQWTQLD